MHHTTPPASTRTHVHRQSATWAIAIVITLGALAALPLPAEAQSPAALTGTVSSTTGDAVGKVDVTATKAVVGDVKEVKSTSTAADGTYTISNLSAGTWNVSFSRDGYQKASRNATIGASGATQLDVTLDPITVTRSGTFVEAQAVDAETAEPIAGAAVELMAWTPAARVSDTTTTDTDGRFRIELYDGENQVTITKRGYRAYVLWTDPQTEEQIDRAPLKMQSVPIQKSTVTGTVTDASTGQPIQALVEISIDWETYERACYAEDQPKSDPVEPEESPESSESSDAMMVAPCGYPYYDNHNSTATGTDGTFTMRSHAGDYQLTVNRVDYAIHRTKFTVAEGETERFEIALKPLPAKDVTLSGKVVDANTGDPIPYASVNAQVYAWGDYEWTETDADGAFRFTMRPGQTLISVYVYDHGRGDYVVMDADDEGDDDDSGNESSSTGAAEPAGSTSMPAPQNRGYYGRNLVITTQAGESRNLNLDMTPKPEPRTTIVGYVVDSETNSGIPDIHVSYQNQATGDWGSAITDETGSYQFTVRGGYSTLHVWSDNHHPTAVDLVVPDSGRIRQDLILTPGESTGRGWWDPDGPRYDDYYGYGYGEEAAMKADGDDAASMGASRSTSDTAASESSLATGSSAEGQQVTGTGGGLPPYDPNAAHDAFGDTEGAPGPGFVVMLAIAGLAAVGLARRRD